MAKKAKTKTKTKTTKTKKTQSTKKVQKAKPVKAKTVKAKSVKGKTVKAKSVKAKTIKAKKAVVKKASLKKSLAKKSSPKKSTPKKLSATKSLAPKKVAIAQKPQVKIDYAKAITPLADRLVVKVASQEKVTAGGLFIPDSVTSTSGYLKGKVLAVGHGSYSKKGHLKPLDVQVGDEIMFSEYVSQTVEFHGEKLHIVNESDVLGIVK